MSASWTNERVYFLIEEYRKAAVKSTAEGTLKSAEWTQVINNFNTISNCNYEKKQLQSKMQELKSDYGIIKTLKELSGFGWDDRNKIVTAPNDVWEAYFVSHPKAKKWKTTSFPFFDDLEAIYEGKLVSFSFLKSYFINNNIHL
jgi:uncharacterized protein YktA (UPF0223 family)